MERWKVDKSYYPLIEPTPNPLLSNGVFPFSEPVLCAYIDLDMLIAEAGLTKAESKIVNWLMQGYGVKDIADHYGTTSKHVLLLLKSASEKISDKNNERGIKCWGNYQVGEEVFS